MLIAVAPSRAPPPTPHNPHACGQQPRAQGIAKKLAVLAGAGGRQIGRANANALAAEGNAGEGWWRNQLARAVIWVTVS
jgi:hypothetical protein